MYNKIYQILPSLPLITGGVAMILSRSIPVMLAATIAGGLAMYLLANLLPRPN
jgi:hypothetical protein